MGIIRRMAFAGSLISAAAIAGTWWLYFKPTVQPLGEEFAGPFMAQWNLLIWAFPTTILLLMVLAAAYLLYGGVQKERAGGERVRRRR